MPENVGSGITPHSRRGQTPNPRSDYPALTDRRNVCLQIPLGGHAMALKDKTLPLLRCERTKNLLGVGKACEQQAKRCAFQKPAT